MRRATTRCAARVVVAQRQARAREVAPAASAPRRPPRARREDCGTGGVGISGGRVSDNHLFDSTLRSHRRLGVHARFALALGGPGLFLVAFLDSSFLSLPEVNDLLLVWMVTRAQGADGSTTPPWRRSDRSPAALVLYYVGREGRRSVPAQALQPATSSARCDGVPSGTALLAVLVPVAAAAADAVQDLRPARRGRRHAACAVRRGDGASAAAFGTSARRCWRCCYGDAGDGVHPRRNGWTGRRSGWRSSLVAGGVAGLWLVGGRAHAVARPLESTPDQWLEPELSVVIPIRNEAPNLEELLPRVHRDARTRGALLRDSSSSTTAARTRRFAILARLQARIRTAARHPVPAQLRPDGGVRRRLRARARPAHRHLRRRPAERSARHPGDGRHARERLRHRLRLAEGPEGRVPLAAAAVDDRQPADLVGDRRPAARLRLLAEGVPRRGRQAAAAVRRDAPVPARRSPASWASRIAEVRRQPPAARGTARRSTASRARSASMLDLLTVKFLLSYSTRPLQIFGLIGFAMALAGVARGRLADVRQVRRTRPGDWRPAAAAALDPADLHRRAARHARPARRAAGAHVPRVAEQADLRDPRDPRSGAARRDREHRAAGGQRRIAWVLLLASAAAVLVDRAARHGAGARPARGRTRRAAPAFWIRLAAAAALTIVSLAMRSLRWIFLLRRAETAFRFATPTSATSRA